VTAARWPLAVLLVLAERKEADASAALSDALAEEGSCRRERDRAARSLRSHREAAEDAARGAPRAGASAGLLAARSMHLGRLRAEDGRLAATLARRAVALAAATAEVGRRRDERGAARAAVRALEESREAWRAARRRDRERAEEEAADEVVSARREGAS
jgi:hypothetical protein